MLFALLIILIVLAIVYYKVANRPSTWPSIRIGLRGASVIFLFLALFVCFLLYKQSTTKSELEKIIQVYPGAETTSWVPPVRAEQYWLFETKDNLNQISDFYKRMENDPEWEIISESGNSMLFIKFIKEDVEITLLAFRKEDKTEMSYNFKRLE